MEFIKLKEVGKEYSKKKVLEDVNLQIQEGDILGIIGESGSGKTTLLSIISGFTPPSVGEAVYYSKVYQEEKSIYRNINKIKKHLGFTPQHNSFYPKLTVKENLFHFGKLYGINEQTLFNNVKSLVEFMRLMTHRNKLAGHLSGGMQKRLNIACSLVHKPKLLILDEPTADLDPVLEQEVLNLIESVNQQGVTVVLATHNLESVEHLCNKIAFINEGKVYSQGSLEQIRQPYLQDYFTISVDSGKEKEMLLERLKVLPVNKIVDEGRQLIVYPANIEVTVKGLLSIINEKNLDLRHLGVHRTSLQDIFKKVVRR